MNREAIHWSTTTNDSNRRERERVTMVNGERRVERLPQRGHLGDYDDKRPAPGQRSVKVLRDSGQEINMVVTSSAADLNPNTTFGMYQKAKAKHFGWLPLAMCPCALHLAGEMDAAHFADKSIVASKPCARGSFSEKEPCAHLVAEKAARIKRHAAISARRDAGFKDSGEKMIEAQREQTTALVGALKDAIGAKK